MPCAKQIETNDLVAIVQIQRTRTPDIRTVLPATNAMSQTFKMCRYLTIRVFNNAFVGANNMQRHQYPGLLRMRDANSFSPRAENTPCHWLIEQSPTISDARRAEKPPAYGLLKSGKTESSSEQRLETAVLWADWARKEQHRQTWSWKDGTSSATRAFWGSFAGENPRQSDDFRG